MVRSRTFGAVFVGLVLVASLTSCDVRVAGTRCKVNGATAQDKTFVLICTKGRWARSITIKEAAAIFVAVVKSKTPETVAAGNGHTCSAMEGGQVRCWGFDSSGQLGLGSTANTTKPGDEVLGVTVRGSQRTSAGATPTELHGSVHLGAEFGCALKPSKLAATTTSTLRCWGFNGFGQLGDATTTNRPTPIQVLASSAGVVSFATGTVHTCAAVDASGVWCSGQNAAGQLGDGTTTARTSFVKVPGLPSDVTLAAGNSHSCSLASGAVSCWGGNGTGQLGDGTTTQRLAPVTTGLTGVTAIAAGGDETCALLSDATVKCWGDNAKGQLGDGTTTSRSAPTAVGGLSGVASISVGADHACAVLADGTARCWGGNGTGQVGDGTTTDRSAPTVVTGVSRATSIAAGFGHSCVVADKKVSCWGRNDFGQLGDGTTTERHVPTPAPI